MTVGADQGVDEGGLAGVELADDDEQEERRQLLGRALHRLPVFLGGGVAAKDVGEALQEGQLLGDQLLLARGEEGAGLGTLAFTARTSRQLK